MAETSELRNASPTENIGLGKLILKETKTNLMI